MSSLRALTVLMALTACGGGAGGGSVSPPTTAPTSLASSAIEIGPTAASAELAVQLVASPAPGTALLQVAVELPPQLTLPVDDRLIAARPLTTLDGDFVDGRFVVLCGDAETPGAAPLTPGPLFRLLLQPSQPRQPGTYTVTLRALRAASAAGDALAAATEPVAVRVTVR